MNRNFSDKWFGIGFTLASCVFAGLIYNPRRILTRLVKIPNTEKTKEKDQEACCDIGHRLGTRPTQNLVDANKPKESAYSDLSDNNREFLEQYSPYRGLSEVQRENLEKHYSLMLNCVKDLSTVYS